MNKRLLVYFQVFENKDSPLDKPLDILGANFSLCPRHAMERGYFGVEVRAIAGEADDGEVLRRVTRKDVIAHLKEHGISNPDPDCEDCPANS